MPIDVDEDLMRSRPPLARALAVLLAAALLMLVMAASASAARHARQVPHGFVGVDVDDSLLARTGVRDHELDVMKRNGVESVRASFFWAAVQPYPNIAAVPAAELPRFQILDGVPTDFSSTDALVAAGARRRLGLLPVVLNAPGWAALNASPTIDHPQPRDPRAYGRFMGALVSRYGPHGSFWAAHPDVPYRPLREWQVWNEPNLGFYWTQPFARSYTAALRAAHDAIKRADPHARIVLAGLTNKSWISLEQLYRAGAGRLFDAVAIHAYTARVRNVVTIAKLVRRVMNRHHDARKPLLLTELSWPSAVGRTSTKFPWDTDQRGQAARVREVYSLIPRYRRSLRIESMYWYAWLTPDASRTEPFDYAGLRTIRGGRVVSKPAYDVFRRAALGLEGR